ADTYQSSFTAAAERIRSRQVHLLGLGCGGGQKDSRLLKMLKKPRRTLYYTPSDVSSAMVLVAQRTARKFVPQSNCFPYVCDFASGTSLSEIISDDAPANAQRLLTFFGMIPNFEPHLILPKLSKLL